MRSASKSWKFASLPLMVTALAASACNGGGGAGGDCEDLVVENPIPGQKSDGNVATYHNDNYRTGQNVFETTLTPFNVRPETFGKIASIPVDGVVYAQPLYVQNVPKTPIGTKNLLIVATEHDSVYAFDADAVASNTQAVWHRNFLGNRRDADGKRYCSTLDIRDVTSPNLSPTGTGALEDGNTSQVEVGITATPVADPEKGILYVVAASKEYGVYYEKLHALSLSTGAELPGSPVVIEGEYKGTGFKDEPAYRRSEEIVINGKIQFQARQQLSRAALALQNNTLFVAYSSYNNQEPTHGWLFSYDTTTLEQTGVFVSTPNSSSGTIWMSGGGPAIDATNNVYFSTGNGDVRNSREFDTENKDDSVIKVAMQDIAGKLTMNLVDFFMPFNRWILVVGLPLVSTDTSVTSQRHPAYPGDVDLGSGGVMLFPDDLPGSPNPHMLVIAGKEGTVHVLNRDHLGGFNKEANDLLQELPGIGTVRGTGGPTVRPEMANNPGLTGGLNWDGNFSTPSYWSGSSKMYILGSFDTLRSYPVVNGRLDAAHVSKAPQTSASRGATTSISSNQNNNGIVWFIDTRGYSYTWSNDPTAETVQILRNEPAELVAFDANNLEAGPIYASNLPGNRAGNPAKFAVPTVAGGKVFVGTQTEVSVYGLKPAL